MAAVPAAASAGGCRGPSTALPHPKSRPKPKPTDAAIDFMTVNQW
jgi:hypothetical protein